MKKKLVPLIFLCLLSAGCAAPETRAGAWTAKTEYGDFTIYVTEDGTAVAQVDYDFKCLGSNASAYDKPFREPAESIEGRKLSQSVIYAFITMVEIEGKFSMDGKQLSGTVTFLPQEIHGGCPTEFTSTR